MATPSPPHVGRERSSSEQIVTIKVLYNDSNRRFKLPLRDLKAHVFPGRVSLHSSSAPDRTSHVDVLSFIILIQPCPLALPFLISIALSFYLILNSEPGSDADSWWWWLRLDPCSAFRRMSTSSSSAIPTAPAPTLAWTATTQRSTNNFIGLLRPSPSFVSRLPHSTPQSHQYPHNPPWGPNNPVTATSTPS